MLKQTRLQLIYVLTIALCTFKVMTTRILIRRIELEYSTHTLCFVSYNWKKSNAHFQDW